MSDDASTDDTHEILREFAGAITVFENPRHQGLARNHNLLMRHARGKYVTFLHQDDEVTAGSFQLRVDALDSNAALGVVSGNSTFVDEWGVPLGPPQTPPLPSPSAIASHDATQTSSLRLRTLAQVLRCNRFQVGSVMMTHGHIDRVGDFWESLTLSVDYDYWLRSLLFSPIGHIPTTVLRFRVHKGQTSQIYRDNPGLAQREIYMAMTHALNEAKRIGVKLPSGVRVKWDGIRCLRGAFAGLPPSFFRVVPRPISHAWTTVFGM